MLNYKRVNFMILYVHLQPTYGRMDGKGRHGIPDIIWLRNLENPESYYDVYEL